MLGPVCVGVAGVGISVWSQQAARYPSEALALLLTCGVCMLLLHQAEFLLRDCRKWDEDGVPDPAGTSFGEVSERVC
jgi:hypothetical protein